MIIKRAVLLLGLPTACRVISEWRADGVAASMPDFTAFTRYHLHCRPDPRRSFREQDALRRWSAVFFFLFFFLLLFFLLSRIFPSVKNAKVIWLISSLSYPPSSLRSPTSLFSPISKNELEVLYIQFFILSFYHIDASFSCRQLIALPERISS